MPLARATVLFFVVIGELFLYLPLARAVRSLAGGTGDVGSQFLGYWLFAVLPGGVAFLASFALLLFTTAKRLPERAGEVLTGAWLANALLLVGSAIGYALRWP